MSEELFDVVFFGILQAGKDKETVMQNMARMFKTDAAKLAPYFAGGRKIIKGKINAEAAEKYRAALENVGLSIKIEPVATTQETAEKTTAPQKASDQAAATETATTKSKSAGIDTGCISMAEVGSDVLEHPTAAAPAQQIDDISSISMAETGVDMLENPVAEVPAQKIDDISAISIAEVGADVLEHPNEVHAQKINDISDITMAETGADIIENPKPKEKAPQPDISELSLDD